MTTSPVHPNAVVLPPPFRVSPFIRACRWGFFTAGVLYGSFRLRQLKKKHNKQRPAEHAAFVAAFEDQQRRKKEEAIRVECIRCIQCSDESCGRADKSGRCNGDVCYKAVAYSSGGQLLMKGCLKKPYDGCATGPVKLVVGEVQSKWCYCKDADFCNRSIFRSGNVYLIAFLMIFALSFIKLLIK